MTNEAGHDGAANTEDVDSDGAADVAAAAAALMLLMLMMMMIIIIMCLFCKHEYDHD